MNDINNAGYDHFKGYIQVYRGCSTFSKFSMERGMIVVKDKIGVISAQLYVTFLVNTIVNTDLC